MRPNLGYIMPPLPRIPPRSCESILIPDLPDLKPIHDNPANWKVLPDGSPIHLASSRDCPPMPW